MGDPIHIPQKAPYVMDMEPAPITGVDVADQKISPSVTAPIPDRHFPDGSGNQGKEESGMVWVQTQ